jgi:hypothetical protein
MATGLSAPFAVKQGRLIRTTGEEQLRKIILLSLSDCSSDNPFQDLGIGIQAIFNVEGPEVRFSIARRIQGVFKLLQAQGRATLSPNYPKFEVNRAQCELVVYIHYINLETATTNELAIVYGGALSGPTQV